MAVQASAHAVQLPNGLARKPKLDLSCVFLMRQSSLVAQAAGTLSVHLCTPNAALLCHWNLLRLSPRWRVPQQQRHLHAIDKA